MLCDEAKRTLQIVQDEIPFTLEEMDIEQHDTLHARYMLHIPVVAYGEAIIQYGHIDYVTISEALEHIAQNRDIERIKLDL